MPAGPPGTGKTYLGVQIAKLLLHNTTNIEEGADGRPVTGPLMLVSFTNHALNEFILDLVKSGIPKTCMVRMGGG